MVTIGDSTAPYRTQAERRREVARRFDDDRDCWFVTTHPETGPCVVPLSFVVTGSTALLATAEGRQTVRNAALEPRVAFSLGGYGDAIRAYGRCEIVRFEDVDASLREKYVAKAGWDPGKEPQRFVALLTELDRVMCSRSPREDGDRIVWTSAEPTPW